MDEKIKIEGRWIQSRFPSVCWRCDKTMETGDEIYYIPVIKKACCKECGLTEEKTKEYDIDLVRSLKGEWVDKRASRRERSAEIRRKKAGEIEGSLPEYRRDWAYITQPGYIPGREKIAQKEEKIYHLQKEAQQFEEKANNIRQYQGRIQGDAERARQAKREKQDELISVGSKVHDFCFGEGVVVRKNKKTYSVKFPSGSVYARDKSWVELRG